MVKITAEEQNKGKRMKRNEDSSETSDNIKCNNMQIIGVPEGEKEQKVSEKYLKRLQLKTP